MSRFISLYLSRMLRLVLKKWLETRALVSRRGFMCSALQGESEYNISINCDMTVSCNCQDDGSGIPATLKERKGKVNVGCRQTSRVAHRYSS